VCEQCKGFTLEYLMRVPEVKDTVHKHSLLYHLCNLVIDQFPRTTDLYSEIGELVRCSKVSTPQARAYKLDLGFV